MTLIPADNKIPIPSGSASELPGDTIPDHNAPPPYSPTDPSTTSPTEERYVPLPHPTPSTTPGPPLTEEYPKDVKQDTKMPESGAVKSNGSVNLKGPLRVLGQISAGGSINVSQNIHVEGKTSSSGSTTFSDHVTIVGKVDSSGSIKASEEVRFEDKLSASGGIELRDNVYVGGKVNASGGVALKNNIEVTDKVECSGSLVIAENVKICGKVSSGGSMSLSEGVEVVGAADAKGKARIGEGSVRIGGNMSCAKGLLVEEDARAICVGNLLVKNGWFGYSNGLTVNGHLHVLGDVDITGNIVVGESGEFIVDGKKTIRSMTANWEPLAANDDGKTGMRWIG